MFQLPFLFRHYTYLTILEEVGRNIIGYVYLTVIDVIYITKAVISFGKNIFADHHPLQFRWLVLHIHFIEFIDAVWQIFPAGDS